MTHVHYCSWCGTSRPAGSAMLLAPSCTACGCTLQACAAGDWPEVEASMQARPDNRASAGDGLGMIAGLAVVPWLLALAGMEVADVLLFVPLVLLVFAASECRAAAARYAGLPRRGWNLLAVAASIAAISAAAGVVATFLAESLIITFYLGAASSVALVAGAGCFARHALRGAPVDRVLDGVLLSLVVIVSSGYFLVEPGMRVGDDVLTAVLVVDLVLLATAGVALAARSSGLDGRVHRRLVCAAAAIVVGDGVICATAAGQLSAPAWVTLLFWALSAFLVASAAGLTRPQPTRRRERPRRTERRWLADRMLPAVIVSCAVPVMLVAAMSARADDTWPLLWFGAAFGLSQLVIFGRQAYVLLDHRRSAEEERAARRTATRRNEELEALTGLATTMTQTLEEAPIVEQALSVLHLAARANSSALHLRDGDRLRLRATAGNWASDHPWADQPVEGERGVVHFERGRRQIVRLPLVARDHDIGVVTLVRPSDVPFGEREIGLLRLLVDQMAVAVQNARDYREKLEQAVRDPLTGAYNRRFFFEALEKEIQRTIRYGSSFSLVLLDVDHFKRINDTLGHGAGDDVLRGLVAGIDAILRPTDSLARVGGEEFAILLPETDKMDALLVAERVRTSIARASFVDGLTVTVSAGVGCAPLDAAGREELVRRTDAALYWAKRNGRDICALVNERTDEIEEMGNDVEAAAANLVSLVGAIDAQHLHTRNHSENVAQYAVALGRALGLGEERLVPLRRAALLHDVGKVAVSPEILDKPGALTDEEFAAIRLHPAVGGTMLHHAGLTDEAAWVRQHHERFDGLGYPDAIGGDDLALESRIIFVADSFEAMTSDRPYRRGMPVAAALEELRRCAGTQFDPAVVEAFCAIVASGELTVMAMRGQTAASPRGV